MAHGRRQRSKLKYLVPLGLMLAGGSEHDPAPRRTHNSFKPFRHWGFITSHARVLLAVAQNPQLRVEGIAEVARVTRRSVYRILADLVEAGYLRRSRAGTRNLYEFDPELPLGDPVVEAQPVGDLLSLIEDEDPSGVRRERGAAPR